MPFTLLPNTHVSATTDYSNIRVKISISETSIPIVIDGEYLISEDSSIGLNRGSYTISVSGTDKVRIQGNGIDKVVGTSITFTRLAYNGSENNHLTLKGTLYDDRNYIGNMKFTVDSNKLFVVNHIPLEQYLYGVVAYEMSDSFPLEALKAQAVCARGYAVDRIKTTGTHDIGDTTSHQVYKGYVPSYANVIQAVNETKGQVLTYNGKIISTYYAASNGGQTELAGNTWGGGTTKDNSYPYLIQKDDPYDLENPSSWVEKFFVPTSPDNFSEVKITGDSVNIRTGPSTAYSKIKVGKKDDVFPWISTNDGWHKMRYHDGRDAYISANQIYSVKCTYNENTQVYCNPVLNDLQNKASERLGISDPADVSIITINSLTNATKRWPLTDSRSYVSANANITVKCRPSGKISNLENLQLQLMEPADGGGYLRSHDYLNKELRFRLIEQASDIDGYYLFNGRYGHGVGMSQRGAQQMASAAHNLKHSDILGFYFVGTQLSNLDTAIPDLPLPGDIPSITSSKHSINGDKITGLSTDLNVNTFVSNISAKNGTVQLVSSSGAAKPSGIVATGDVLQLKYKDSNSIYRSYPLVIYGDVNGDGKISIVDLLRVQKYLLKTTKLTGPYFTAADVSKDGSVKILDLLRIQKHLLKTSTIKQ